jgi:hypothetical protein
VVCSCNFEQLGSALRSLGLTADSGFKIIGSLCYVELSDILKRLVFLINKYRYSCQ